MSILTRSEDVEGDLTCSVGAADFAITDAEPQYQTDDPDVIEFAHRSNLIDVAADEAPVEEPAPKPVVVPDPAPTVSETPTTTTGAFS